MDTTKKQVRKLMKDKKELGFLQKEIEDIIYWMPDGVLKSRLMVDYDNLCKRKKELDEPLDNLLKKQDDKQ